MYNITATALHYIKIRKESRVGFGIETTNMPGTSLNKVMMDLVKEFDITQKVSNIVFREIL